MNDNMTRAERVAAECAAEMRRQLQYHTPAEMGFPDMTVEELVESEYRCWLAEETRLARLAEPFGI
jgi:hypothetical protein